MNSIKEGTNLSILFPHPEMSNFKNGSEAVINAITARTGVEGVSSIIGGGDTVSLLNSIPGAY